MKLPCTLKMRCGKETYVKRDGSTGTAGKGALVASESAFTVAATQDQTLITGGGLSAMTATAKEDMRRYV